jgi:hypothetical protein
VLCVLKLEETLMRNPLILTCLIAISTAAFAQPQDGHPLSSGYGNHGRSPASIGAVILAGAADDGGYFNVKFKTGSAAVLCANPFDIKEAVAAMTDTAWLKSLNCLVVPAGLDVTKIEPAENSLTEPWKVRLHLPSGAGATLWGYAFSFTLPNGNRVSY